MSGAPINADFQNPLNLMNNPHQINNTQYAQQRGNSQHQFNPNQMNQIQQGLTTPQQFSQQQQMKQGNPMIHSQMNPEQQNRISQVNQMTESSFQKQMNRIGKMNDQILSHHMSNMSSYNMPPASMNQPEHPQFVGNREQMGNHYRFPDQVPSDHAPMIQPGTNKQYGQQHHGVEAFSQFNGLMQQDEPKSYESSNARGYASLDMESTMPNVGKT